MRPLLADELLEVWEIGERQHPIDKALTLLASAYPELDQEKLATLSIGQRDALLFYLRERIFGSRLDAFSECPSCREQLEFSMDSRDLLTVTMTPETSEMVMDVEGFTVHFRLPNSIDLAASINRGDDESQKTLLSQCVIRVSQNNMDVTGVDLPEMAVEALLAKMLEYDPLSEVRLDLDCLACGHRWSVILDILSFFWKELEVRIKVLLNQVHVLARAYGWREADILSMSDWRRQYYIDMVTS